MKMGPIGCPETSVKYYHSTLRNIPEERISHQHRGGSLKSRVVGVFVACLQNTASLIIPNEGHKSIVDDLSAGNNEQICEIDS